MSKGGANTPQQMPVAMQQNPVPTQPGFAVGAPMGQPAGQMPYQPFSSFRGQNPFGNQFGPFNPAANQQIGAYRQQVQDWRSMRPEFAQGDQRMDFRQQMQDWRSARPNFAPIQPAMQTNPALTYDGLLSSLIGG